ncbi:NPL4 family-domain-containing protein [Polychytrium aggregatum]|uniref:NPL4 family-domain-containing protein n=1 Tax=Polychytrium aggregatum TaxID=110093 RepID=UPI0022FE145C|nr:NPL4 family-domain-containing protein [Polychytrium aggregatum]KAI9199682.1 NPL4 family-domain-containing protein [Polychytrium aggregatum]
MIIRARTPEGQLRIEIEPSSSVAELVQKIVKAGSFSSRIDVFLDPPQSKSLAARIDVSLASVPLRHGDMVYVAFAKDGDVQTPAPRVVDTARPLIVEQDPVDNILEKQKGIVKRDRDVRFCRHGSSGMCDYCMPLEPYDAKYLEENKIKHMSFHAYIKQLTAQSKATSSKFIPPLDDFDFSVKMPCPSKSHDPYPNGICTKCQPSSITLQPQGFRMVDHIEFEDPSIIENIVHFWRTTGTQRFGYLYGRYEVYDKVPLGVKAIVCAVYEPPQLNEHDAIQLLLPDAAEAKIDQVAKQLGLCRVGMIYTDLLDSGKGNGLVVCKRHEASYFLSSAECLFSAEMQNKHLTKTRYAPTGTFGSRFVTCVITGNREGAIDIESYQVSNVAMAMERDKIVEACVKPDLMRVQASTSEKYVPEVFYKYKNQYSIMVKEPAKPTFPVDYLLVTVTHGFPQTPAPFFDKQNAFPIENRDALGVDAGLTALEKRLKQYDRDLVQALSDFHALLFLSQSGILEENEVRLMLDVVRTKDAGAAAQLSHSGGWMSMLEIAKQTSSGQQQRGTGSAHNAAGSSAPPPVEWDCRHCTFRNSGGHDSCDICGLPRD